MIATIVQARMTSTRLPGKVLKEVMGRPLLSYLIERLRFCRFSGKIILATTTNEEDNAIALLAKREKLAVYRGSENDVLDRYYKTAKEFRVDHVIRITSDCPLLDPRVTDLVVSHYLEGKYDYVSNVLARRYPDGLDTEVFSFQALEKTWQEAKLPSEREHVTPYIYKHPELFRLSGVRKNGKDLSWMRWTVDTAEDFEFVSKIFSES
jgi:spore coat polysaccharide biosynthesis protein SpsF